MKTDDAVSFVLGVAIAITPVAIAAALVLLLSSCVHVEDKARASAPETDCELTRCVSAGEQVVCLTEPIECPEEGKSATVERPHATPVATP